MIAKIPTLSARAVLLIATVLAVGALSPPSVLAAVDRQVPAPTGTWRLAVTNPGGGEFYSLMVFHRDGTLTERVSSGPGESSSVGLWRRRPGQWVAVTMEQFRDSDGDGAFDRRFLVRLMLQITGHDTMSGTSDFEVRTLDGQTLLAGPFVGFTVEARRMTIVE